MKFITEIWHPNIDKNGDVCISILHEPGDDKWGYEKASERWLPVHTVETILISVISMLADPNDESPANVDAAVSFIYMFMYLKNIISHLFVLSLLRNADLSYCRKSGGKVIRNLKERWRGA